MLTNYIKIALRNIMRNKLHSFINIIGLSIGMACTIMIMLWVIDELSYDRFHENYDNLYRVLADMEFSNRKETWFKTPYPLAASLKNDYPEIVEAVRLKVWPSRTEVVYGDKRFEEADCLVADSTIFSVFTFPFLKGDPSIALSEPGSIVITRKIAEKIFGKEDAIGKTLRINNEKNHMVTGVIENIPANSSLQFDYVIPLEDNSQVRIWNNFEPVTYILIRNDNDIKLLEKEIKGYIKNKNPDSKCDLRLQPVSDIHLHTDFTDHTKTNGSIYNVYLFSILSLFILLISCINYISLATARYSVRAKEVGIRKVTGATRAQLVIQFLCESVVIALISLIVSLCLIELFLPSFNRLSGKELSVNYLCNYSFMFSILIFGLFTGVAAGSYPSFILSLLSPVNTLKSVFRTGVKGAFFRKGMVLIQWTITIILIIGVWITLSQINYMKDEALGYNSEQVLYLKMDEDLKKKYETVENEFKKDPAVLNVSCCWYLPNAIYTSTSNTDWENRKEEQDHFVIRLNVVDYNYPEIFDMKIANGRSFSKEFSSDLLDSFMLNETAVKKMGLENPVGKWFSVWGMKGPIIGILKDYHLDKLDTKIEPLVFSMSPDNRKRNLLVKIRPDYMQETIERLEEELKEINPNNSYEFRFLDDDFNYHYKSEEVISKILQSFTGLGIFVAALGLVALVGFMAEERTKEIGVRKSLGASALSITLLMSGTYFKLVVISNIIAWPVAWYIFHDWLENYPYRINMGWVPFIGAGLFVLIISQIIVSYHSIKAAVADPVKALRYE